MAEGPIAALPQQVRENSRRIAELRDEIRELRRSVIRMEQRWGLDHENMAADLMPQFLASKGLQVQRIAMVPLEGKVDLVLEVEETEGRWMTWVVRVKGRVWGSSPVRAGAGADPGCRVPELVAAGGIPGAGDPGGLRVGDLCGGGGDGAEAGGGAV